MTVNETKLRKTHRGKKNSTPMDNKYSASLAHFGSRSMIVCLWDDAMSVSHVRSVSSPAVQTNQVKKMRENSPSRL